jgi:DNA-directed RNA polymerase specialized sigma24 family protein
MALKRRGGGGVPAAGGGVTPRISTLACVCRAEDDYRVSTEFDENDDDDTAAIREIDDGHDDVSAELKRLWVEGVPDHHIYKFLSKHVSPRIKAFLKSATGLQEADREDCASIALERFAPAMASRFIIRNPYAYIFTIAVNEARQLLRARKLEWVGHGSDVAADAQECAGWVPNVPREPLPPAEDLAMAVIADAVSELEAEPFWAIEVVRTAISRLPLVARRVIEQLQYEHIVFAGTHAGDFDYQSNEARADLGMSQGAFRTAKHRAYAKLREEIPRVIVEMGLDPPERADAVLFPNGRPHEDE